jgi:hypothetical protein
MAFPCNSRIFNVGFAGICYEVLKKPWHLFIPFDMGMK